MPSWLERKITSVCGNILFNIYDDRIELSTGSSQSSLSNIEYKNIKTSDVLSDDIHRVFSSATPHLLFSGDDFESQKNKKIITLIINDRLPTNMFVMKKNGSANERDHTIVKSYDFSSTSPIGKYFQTHLSRSEVALRPVYVDFSTKKVILSGIDVKTGSITKKTCLLENITNKNITDLFVTNFLIPANIFQICIDYTYDDDHYLLVGDAIKLATLIPDTFNVPFVPFYSNRVLNEPFQYTVSSGLLLHQGSNLPYQYCRSKSGKPISSANSAGNRMVISESISVTHSIKEEFSFKRGDDEKIVIFKISSFSQSDKVRFVFENDGFELIADALFNKPNFGKTDNERFVFNPTGTISEQCVSLCGAFNHMTENKMFYTAEAHGEYMVIKATLKNAPFELLSISSDKMVLYKSNPAKVHGDTFSVLTDVSKDLTAAYIKTNIGYHKVIWSCPHFEIIDGKLAITGKKWFCEKNYSGTIDLDRIWQLDGVEYGIISTINESVLQTAIVTNKTIIKPYLVKYLHQDKLVVGKRYVVLSGSITHGGVLYPTNSSFVATGETYSKETSFVDIRIERYLLDDEVQLFLSRHTIDILDSNSVDIPLSWVLLDAKDSKQEKYELEFSQTQNFDQYDFDPLKNTHSLYNISDSIGSVFDLDSFKSPFKDYFEGYFKDSYSKIAEDSYGSSTIFNGAKFFFPKEYSGFRFSMVLNVFDISAANTSNSKPVKFSMVKNDVFKTISMVITLYVSDYKATDGNTTYVDYAYIAMMSQIAKIGGEYGDQFTIPPINGIIFQNPSTLTNTNTFRGTKINFIENPLNALSINEIVFDGDYVRLDSWVRPSLNDFGAIIGYDEEKNSFISTSKNSHIGSGYFELGENIPFYCSGNSIVIPSGEMYVLSINGTIYDQTMTMSLLKSIESFKNYKWFHVTKTDNTYSRIGKLLSMAGISTIINSGSVDFQTEVSGVSVIKPDINGFYNENFSINTSEKKGFSGGVVPENWYVIKDSWRAISPSWESFPDYVDINLIFENTININKTTA